MVFNFLSLSIYGSFIASQSKKIRSFTSGPGTEIYLLGDSSTFPCVAIPSILIYQLRAYGHSFWETSPPSISLITASPIYPYEFSARCLWWDEPGAAILTLYPYLLKILGTSQFLAIYFPWYITIFFWGGGLLDDTYQFFLFNGLI